MEFLILLTSFQFQYAKIEVSGAHHVHREPSDMY